MDFDDGAPGGDGVGEGEGRLLFGGVERHRAGFSRAVRIDGDGLEGELGGVERDGRRGLLEADVDLFNARKCGGRDVWGVSVSV